MENEILNIGVVGAGGFAGFVINLFRKIEGINIVAITDLNVGASNNIADGFEISIKKDVESLLADKGVDLVYIATPPYLHYSQSKSALLAGKHVICEKPAAMSLAEAEELSSIASATRLLYAVDLMQRYNPYFNFVRLVTEKKLLGNFIHGFFENYASDEKLDENHWFWDRNKSGGIFIEHAVHFFDLFAGWLGRGEVVSALQFRRPGYNDLIDRVSATVSYASGPVHFYHGFDQPGMLDRQELRLLFEHGEISMYGWIPSKIVIYGLADTASTNELQSQLPQAVTRYNGDVQTKNGRVEGRFRQIDFTSEVTITHGNLNNKAILYAQMISDFLRDQLTWIKNKDHARIIDDKNAIESLRVAEAAAKMAKTF